MTEMIRSLRNLAEEKKNLEKMLSQCKGKKRKEIQKKLFDLIDQVALIKGKI